MSYIPKYILKRLIPANAFFTVDKNGDGKADAIGFYIVNVISPLALPADIPKDPKELAKLAGVDDLSSLITVTLDGVDLKFDFNKLELRYEGKGVRMANLADAAGITIPVGGKVVVIYDYPESEYPPGMNIVGEHELVVKYNIAGQSGEIGAKREVTSDRVKLKYPPDVNTFK
ncbi:MAG: hypothetical protein JW839_08385 [Candidatus Lokiarchaeota archaeon]|nr:hypothetical protein [Candidatus Lokiarchaeota archaeon]